MVRILLIAAGFVTSWFFAADAPNFGVIQGMVLLVLIVLVVFVAGFWPPRWTEALRVSKTRQ
jgi:hypothetical protein